MPRSRVSDRLCPDGLDARVGLGYAWLRIGVPARAAGELQFGWATLDRIVASVGASNSAASSTTGAYRYLTAAVALRIGI